jgi:hypothetical protein
VVDSSTAFKWVVAEVDSGKAIHLLDDFRNGVIELVTPTSSRRRWPAPS